MTAVLQVQRPLYLYTLTWDESGGMATLLADTTNDYIYADDSTPFAQINRATGDITYLHGDHQGSITLTTNAQGQQVSTYTYDAYGKQTSSTGDANHTITPFGYTGQYLDTDTGLYYLRARWYEPTTGLFLSTDPLQPTTHETYGYASANPVVNTDPTGLYSFGDFLGAYVNQLHGMYAPIVDNPVVQAVANNGAQVGFGILDGFTGGLSTMAIDAIAPGAINHCSAYFQWSSGISTVVSMFVPGEGIFVAAAAAVKVAGRIVRLASLSEDLAVSVKAIDAVADAYRPIVTAADRARVGTYGKVSEGAGVGRRARNEEIEHIPSQGHFGNTKTFKDKYNEQTGPGVLLPHSLHKQGRTWGSKNKKLLLTEQGETELELVKRDWSHYLNNTPEGRTGDLDGLAQAYLDEFQPNTTFSELLHHEW